MIVKHSFENRKRLKFHIRMRVKGTTERPRFTVYRSGRHMYAQIVDDSTGKTVVSVSSLSKDHKDAFRELKGHLAISKRVGELAAKMAVEKKIKEVVFDRNGYLYHGAVKALADAAREGGLKF